MSRSPVILTVATEPRRGPKLYRRATDQPTTLTRPAVVQSRIAECIGPITGRRSSVLLTTPTRRRRHKDRGWLVISPWRIPGHQPLISDSPLSIARVSEFAEAIALATASARQHAQQTPTEPTRRTS